MAYLNLCCLKEDKSSEKAEKQGEQSRVRKSYRLGTREVSADETIVHEKVAIFKRCVGTNNSVKYIPNGKN